MNDNLKTWPKSFFSHHRYETVPDYEDVEEEDLEMCHEKRQDNDIEYIRKDIHDERVKELEDRLEIDHRHKYDGIACRDETIKLLEDRVKELEAKVAQLEAERNKIIAETVEKCIKFVEGGNFMRDDHPGKLFAKECGKEMRKQLLPTNGGNN